MKKLVFLLIPAILFVGCKKDEEQSDEAKILDFTVTSTSISNFSLEDVFIDEESSKILVLSQNDLAGENPPISFTPEISVSEGATIVPPSGQAVSFNNKDGAITYIVTAANGTETKWAFTIRDMQLPNGGFEDWYDTVGMNSLPLLEPGFSAASTIWSTANMATSLYDKSGTTPLADGDNTLVKIVTDNTPTVPITSATIFTGRFDMQGAIKNPTDPDQATLFGIPFTFRPTAIKFKYKYTPGEDYIEGTLNDPTNIFGGFTIEHLDGGDKCFAWSNLEIIDGNDITLIGRAELIQGDTIAELTEVTLPYVYQSDLRPTHITVVFASSKEGSKYTGAVGSTLIIDDVELIYE